MITSFSIFYFTGNMKLPFFYKEDLQENDSPIVLDEPASKHIIQVLRMEKDEQLQLTNGRGLIVTVKITDDNRKRCSVEKISAVQLPPPRKQVQIAISPVKNSSRFEWFLEKATEIGVTGIIPLICDRTEKTQLKTERLTGILVSAMLQSQQCWLPVLAAPLKFADLITGNKNAVILMAHCEEDQEKILPNAGLIDHGKQTIVLIGPEGDFTKKEIDFALEHSCIPVSLGETRLRTETAGMVAAVMLVNL
ncbi:MAG: ribosomal small subunit methyltransferase [Ferruginibacter sp.]|nr:ribosomal small subunit methyltransferase [Ferruginibacter sp.]